MKHGLVSAQARAGILSGSTERKKREGYFWMKDTADLLRFVTCGSVDEGKSTLVARLLRDTAPIFEDEPADIAAASRIWGTRGDGIDLALLVDGLEAERAEGATIDVAYRSFQTSRRRLVVADAPGHVRYTRSLVAGASSADLALILVDAKKGLLTQTFRHAAIAGLLGIPHVILAVNKMDLVDWDEGVFRAIEETFRHHAARLGFSYVDAVPVSAVTGANVLERPDEMPWYRGETLLTILESASAGRNAAAGPFRMPVQSVGRPGCSGLIVSGTVRPGMEVVAAPSLRSSTVSRIVTLDGDLEEAGAGESVTLELTDDIDIASGHVLAASDRPPQTTDQFAAHIIWMDEDDLLPERLYLMKSGTRTTTARVTDLRHRLHVDTLEHVAARTLSLNDIGYCNLALDQTIACDPYREVNGTGSFILIDRFTNRTVAAGMIDFGLRRATNLERQAIDVGKDLRAAQKHQKPCILWFTGLSGSGKSTTANHVERRLAAMGRHSYLLDGDNIRFGLNRDLGFTDADRVENIRRIAEVARLFADAGLIVLVSFISPFRAERQMARELVDEGEFVEVFVDTPLEVCEARDPKGLYRKARAGELRNFTGIESAYEAPEDPDIVLKAAEHQPDELAGMVMSWLVEHGHLDEAGGTGR
ncbi:MAG: adenylyl-sulfate kinase [bacterium]|nr:adenylyl-sulfate kinase [bacterium]